MQLNTWGPSYPEYRGQEKKKDDFEFIFSPNYYFNN